jgi:hypothetical protein
VLPVADQALRQNPITLNDHGNVVTNTFLYCYVNTRVKTSERDRLRSSANALAIANALLAELRIC